MNKFKRFLSIAAPLTTMLTLMYCFFFAINWTIVSFVDWTGLNWLVRGWVGSSIAYTGWLYWKEWPMFNNNNDDDYNENETGVL